ncbi:alpha/beta hydrolase fold-domain-containing protein [Blastocladiella britannica]|nr:alpha/beta hydrolase fold-domain-containing protein [Blastocladiella britannica]
MPQTLPPPGLGLDDSSSLFVVEEDDDLPYPKNRNHTNHLSSNDDDDEKAALAMIPPALMDQIQLAAALSCCSPGSAAASRSASRAPSCVPPRSPAISLRARTTAPLAPSSPSSSPGGGSSLENGRCSGTVPITDEDGLSDPPTTAQVLRVAAATLATTTTLTLAAAAGPASAPGGPMPSTPRMLLNLIPQLVKTASQIGWQTSAALARHVLYGPPHTSWSWQATAVRAILRSAMIENPIALEGSTYLARRFTQFTYPTSPHKQAYVPTWLLFEGRTKETEMDKKWMESNVCTEAGQTAGYATSGEFVRSVGVTDAEIDQLVLYVHGGAFHFLSARTHRCITSKIVQYSPRTAVFATHQRLGPEHNHAAAVEDVILVYLALIGLRPAARHAYSEHPLANLNATALAPDLRTTVRCSEPPPLARRIWQPDQIVIAGDSSGGNTATSAVLVLKECGFPLPGSLALLSPWLDPPSTSASWVDNGPTCYLPADIPGLYEGVVEFCKPFACSHPFISPIYATSEMLRGLPPVLIQVGGGEVLRDEGIGP